MYVKSVTYHDSSIQPKIQTSSQYERSLDWKNFDDNVKFFDMVGG